MTDQDAIHIALGSRPAFEVSDEFQTPVAQKRVIELVEPHSLRDEPPGPGPVRDLVAWVVRLHSGVLWVEFAIEDATRKVVRFRRSRSAALYQARE